MNKSNDQELVDRWRNQPAPLLPLLNAVHDRDGVISEEAMMAVAKGLKIPIADLFGTVSFYHHFARELPGQKAPRVCTGPVCCLKGGREILSSLESEGASSMPCAGRCDEPVPVLQGHEVLTGTDAGSLESRPSPLPVPNPGGAEE